MSRSFLLRNLLILLVLCVAAAAAEPGTKAPPDPDLEYTFHSVLPLGIDAVTLRPGKHTLYLLAAAESVGFDGVRRIRTAPGEYQMLEASGHPMTAFPQFMDFRIMATRRNLGTPDLDPFPLEQPVADMNQYMLGLQFQLKIFHGIECRTLAPVTVQLIGMPGDVPYDERVYRASFNLGQVPIGDKLVLQILDAQGQRLAKFHLELP